MDEEGRTFVVVYVKYDPITSVYYEYITISYDLEGEEKSKFSRPLDAVYDMIPSLDTKFAIETQEKNFAHLYYPKRDHVKISNLLRPDENFKFFVSNRILCRWRRNH